MVQNDGSQIKSIAIPAIGCGAIGCDVKFASRILINAALHELQQHPQLQLCIKFVIQPDKSNMLDIFMNQLGTLQSA